MRLGVLPSLVIATAALSPCWGCGGSAARTMTTLPVKGKVTYKGQPLVRGTVLFEPDGAGREARGEIKTDGTFVLSTHKEGDGAVPGNHRVSITGGTGKASSAKIPGKYGSLGSSKLEIEVTAEKTDYPFDLP